MVSVSLAHPLLIPCCFSRLFAKDTRKQELYARKAKARMQSIADDLNYEINLQDYHMFQ